MRWNQYLGNYMDVYSKTTHGMYSGAYLKIKTKWTNENGTLDPGHWTPDGAQDPEQDSGLTRETRGLGPGTQHPGCGTRGPGDSGPGDPDPGTRGSIYIEPISKLPPLALWWHGS